MKALLVGLIVAALAISTRATSPKLNSVTPAGGQRGTELELKLNGARLEDAPEVFFVRPGITVAKIDAVKTNSIRALVRIAPDCTLGEHQIRIRTASGVSDLRTFWVSAYTNLAEFETNNTTASAHRVPMGITITGNAGGEDVDFFRVEAKKGQRISAEVEAMRLARSMLDPYLSIRDGDGKNLAATDDTTLLLQDAFVSIIAPADGKYFIEMRDGTYSGNGTDYRLHIGAFPRPTGVYPAGGKAGETVSVKLIGDPAGEFSQDIKLPASGGDRIGAFAERDGHIAPSPNWVRLSTFGNVLENEPNDTREAATPHYGDAPIAFNGIISKKTDVDWFRITAKKGQALDVNVYARRLRSPIDTTLSITDAKGGQVASNDDATGADSAAKFTVPADGDYFIKIRDQFEQGGPDFVYRVEVTPQTPLVTLSIPEVARYDMQTRQYITVPRGNRFATMISAKRANFAGDLNFSAADLPGGVKLNGDTLAAKLELEPLVFEAASDAPIGGKYVDLVARPAETGKTTASRYRHLMEFIQGPNQTFYYSTTEEKLYVAVCDSVPFSVRIEEPKAPLVQYGAIDLKIIAERRAGFDEPIAVKLMWNPPGVGSLPDITIPKGASSAVYSLNAKGDAETRKWKVAVLASAPVRGGPVHVSSPLTTLEIAEPFVVGTVQPVIVSPGQEAKLVCKLDQRKHFDGKARIHLMGLPDDITATDTQITSADKEVTIKLKVGPKVAPASYRNFLCAADVIHNGHVIPHNLANGAVIRVVPPKKGDVKQVAIK